MQLPAPKSGRRLCVGVQRISTLLRFESGLTDAFREVRRMQSGKEFGTALREFLQEFDEA
ncbi:MAG: hypothetical protein MUF71_15455 [Candidatus Kapabacteria bacterium]|nr:hypothetical protein [Candidatus Kapabacteria bacterium]